jgi:hypothetical protein
MDTLFFGNMRFGRAIAVQSAGFNAPNVRPIRFAQFHIQVLPKIQHLMLIRLGVSTASC